MRLLDVVALHRPRVRAPRSESIIVACAVIIDVEQVFHIPEDHPVIRLTLSPIAEWQQHQEKEKC